jgi:hypothetical protein
MDTESLPLGKSFRRQNPLSQSQNERVFAYIIKHIKYFFTEEEAEKKFRSRNNIIGERRA